MSRGVPAGLGVRWLRGGALRLGVCALLLCAPGMAAAGWFDPVPLRATVVWTRADRVYLAAAESVALDAGMLLSFEYQGKVVATGEVTAVSNGELIAARLMTGTLGKIKKLDRIGVTVARPPIRPARQLRVGFPGGGRPNLLFACDSVALDPAGPARIYRLEERGARTYRLTRNPDSTAAAPWPDTLLIRLFDEAADEEIALERGELDAAVFWPGEASTHIRDAIPYRGETKGTMARGLLAVVASGPVQGGSPPAGPPSRRPFGELNDGLFRGDLVPCWSPAGRDGFRDLLSPLRPRIEVDSSCPGRQVLEQFLNRPRGASTAPAAAGVVRLVYLPISPSEIDTVRANCIFRVACPVVSRPALRPYLHALGPDALVNLLSYATTGRKR